MPLRYLLSAALLSPLLRLGPFHTGAATKPPASCPDSAIGALRAYVNLDSSGARLSSSSYQSSGIRRLVDWEDEPGYDESRVVVGWEVRCLTSTHDFTVALLTLHSLGTITASTSGDAHQFIPAADTVSWEVALQRKRARWVILAPLWGPAISVATAHRSFHLTNAAALDSAFDAGRR
jgi:hypothetical protein